jgi:hypothetical protein
MQRSVRFAATIAVFIALLPSGVFAQIVRPPDAEEFKRTWGVDPIDVGAAIAAIRAADRSLARMPVKEVTIFKDGHALLLHAGKMPTDAAGNVTLDYLPAPVMGTFWSASADKTVKLAGVTASQHRVAVSRTALNLRELLEANVGAEVIIREIPDGTAPAPGSAAHPGPEYPGTIVAIPERSAEELEATSAPNTAPKLPQKGSILLLKTDSGTRVIDLDRIQEVAFKGAHQKTHVEEELRNLLTLKLQWPDNKPQPQADVNMMYLQKGIRWIPSYKLAIDGHGNATAQLQATIINELYDLQDTTAHLVVGVPSFAFAGTQDPIALSQAVAQLSTHFQPSAQTAYAFSNAIMTQTAGAGGGGMPPGMAAPAPAALDLGPELAGSKKAEDLFIFTINHLTLKKGDRVVVPITEYKVPYRDVFILDLPFTPPPEVWRHFPTSQQADIARLFNAPKFMHTLRFTNKSEAPFTTAPALIVKDDRVLAQTLMTYTPIGGEVDVTLTAAIDLIVKKSDQETKRTPNAEQWDGYEFFRIDLDGSIQVTNRRGTKVDLEITRNVLGQADKASLGGQIEMLNSFEDRSFAPVGPAVDYPYWWGWYGWPGWWSHFNGVGKVTWKTTLEPDKTLDLVYSWHYYWR